MVTLIEINKAINDKIKAALVGTEFSDVTVLAEDIKEPIVRPSIKIQLGNSINGMFNSCCRDKNLTCRVYFFAKDRINYKIDNIKMQDLIENVFLDDLKVNDNFYIPIDDVSSEVIDSVLECSFELYTIELLPDTDTSETMDELNLDI